MSSLPKYFAVRYGQYCKVFLNALYKPDETSNTINVLWPVDFEPGVLTMRMKDEKQELSHIRKWNSNDSSQTSWYIDGSSIKVTIVAYSLHLHLPVIVIDKDLLPFNCYTYRPESERFVEEPYSLEHESPRLFTTDPASPENQHPIPAVSRSIRIAPVPSPVPTSSAMAMAMAAPVPVPTSTIRGLPPHIKNIVLANSISKNETCPITTEDITMENGAVTSCGHVFCSEAITRWLSSKHECPVCKQTCSV